MRPPGAQRQHLLPAGIPDFCDLVAVQGLRLESRQSPRFSGPPRRQGIIGWGCVVLGMLSTRLLNAEIAQVVKVGVAPQVQQRQGMQQAEEMHDLREETLVRGRVHRRFPTGPRVGVDAIQVWSGNIAWRVEGHRHASAIEPLAPHLRQSSSALPVTLISEIRPEHDDEADDECVQLVGVWVLHELILVRNDGVDVGREADQIADSHRDAGWEDAGRPCRPSVPKNQRETLPGLAIQYHACPKLWPAIG
mmetsp:Transcript_56132/g.162603  ORF Transcript_56132/g.162603 Transcript_56132/m.162603 type:complete len:249 (+) Transcript_56132:1314-2060(+)